MSKNALSSVGPTASTTKNPLDLPFSIVVDNLLPLLDNRDLAALRLVSRHARELTDDEVLWKRKTMADFRFPAHATARVGGWRNLYRGLSRPKAYVWGDSGNGRLGLSARDIDLSVRRDVQVSGGIPYPYPLASLGASAATTGSLVEIVAGGWSFHARTSAGKVWFWGTMAGDEFAGPHSTSREPGLPVPIPRLLEPLPPVISLSGGRSHAVALTDKGDVLEWKAWGTVWKLEGFPDSVTTPTAPAPETATNSQRTNIKQLEAGWSFSAILTHDGEIWLWYSDWSFDAYRSAYFAGNELLALHYLPPQGHENDLVFPLPINPIQLPSLPADSIDPPGASPTIVQIAAGEDFVIARTDRGTVHRLDLHLPSAPTADEWPLIRQLQERLGPDTWDLPTRIQRARLDFFLTHTANWESLDQFSRPQELPGFQAEWLQSLLRDQGPVAQIGGVSHVSAHFRHFVTFHSIAGGRNEVVEAMNDATVVLLGAAGSSAPTLIPELQARGVIKVTMGDYHFGALTSDGSVLTWGQFSKGALGNWTRPSSSPAEAGAGPHDGSAEGDGWSWNTFISLPSRILRGPGRPRVGHAGRGAATPSVHRSAQPENQNNVDRPTHIHFPTSQSKPNTAAREGGQDLQCAQQQTQRQTFAYDIAFAGWHSSALVLDLDQCRT
ncbi:RCC1/BLIP-II [Testicularia cyperi]|uniref:RCC1/BLIP-II n=1 Tax=Testicularia cyperi TaxID=1882483 RepID=A0A317XZ36_9BASI|nr:RCC1/BLIP-II [Testicularia cyperi]